MIEPWRVVSSRVEFADRWLRLRTDRCVDGLGREIEAYHVLEFPTWINVVALTGSGAIVLAREYRHGAGLVLTGLPCGAMEPEDRDPEFAARRELVEETGYHGGTFHALASDLANPANQDNRAWSFLAVDVEPGGESRPDPTERIEVVTEDFPDLLARLWRAEVPVQASHAAALHRAGLAIAREGGPGGPALRRRVRAELDRYLGGG